MHLGRRQDCTHLEVRHLGRGPKWPECRDWKVLLVKYGFLIKFKVLIIKKR